MAEGNVIHLDLVNSSAPSQCDKLYYQDSVNNDERDVPSLPMASVLQLSKSSIEEDGDWRFGYALSVNPKSSTSGYVDVEIRYSINGGSEVVVDTYSTQNNFNWNGYSSFFAIALNEGDSIDIYIYMNYLNVQARVNNTRIESYKVT